MRLLLAECGTTLYVTARAVISNFLTKIMGLFPVTIGTRLLRVTLESARADLVLSYGMDKCTQLNYENRVDMNVHTLTQSGFND